LPTKKKLEAKLMMNESVGNFSFIEGTQPSLEEMPVVNSDLFSSILILVNSQFFTGESFSI
jgi:hypothetical protein